MSRVWQNRPYLPVFSGETVMVITMAGQMKQLLIMAVFGFCAANVYDWLRSIRRIIIHDAFGVGVEDLIFWLVFALSASLLVFRLNYGELRFFLLLGIVIGAGVYYAVISPVFLKITAVIFKTVILILRFVFGPFIIVYSLFSDKFEYFVNSIKKLLQNLWTCGKIYLAFLCKKIKTRLNIILRKR